jgi:branched-chain amino acid transport system permease protein
MLMTVGLYLYLSKTFTGRAILAVSQDRQALQLMGADPVKIKQVAFGLALATASIAGALLIIIGPVEPSINREYIGRAFAIVVLGGMGSITGTVIAAFILGIAESFVQTFAGPSWAPAVSFGILLLTLAVRPAGILGRQS